MYIDLVSKRMQRSQTIALTASDDFRFNFQSIHYIIMCVDIHIYSLCVCVCVCVCGWGWVGIGSVLFLLFWMLLFISLLLYIVHWIHTIGNSTLQEKLVIIIIIILCLVILLYVILLLLLHDFCFYCCIKLLLLLRGKCYRSNKSSQKRLHSNNLKQTKQCFVK